MLSGLFVTVNFYSPNWLSCICSLSTIEDAVDSLYKPGERGLWDANVLHSESFGPGGLRLAGRTWQSCRKSWASRDYCNWIPGQPLAAFQPRHTSLPFFSIFFLASINNLQSVHSWQTENQLVLISSLINFSLSGTHRALVGNKLTLLPVLTRQRDSGWKEQVKFYSWTSICVSVEYSVFQNYKLLM